MENKYNKVVLAGGCGYLGGVFAAYYRHLAKEVIIFSRQFKMSDLNVRTVVWDTKTEGSWQKELEGADMLINLCGKNVNCRYTKKNQEEILASRLISTKLLCQVISKMEHPPKLWINITSATIYRHAEDRPQDEATGDIGYGFSVDVCRAWEDAFFNSVTSSTRKIALRMGIVLGGSDSVFPRLLNLVKFGLGGRQGDGQQYVSWVHELDAAKSTEWLINHPELEGVINCTAPAPVKNYVLMRVIRKAFGVPAGMPSPAWLLAIGAWLIGTETELILKSRWVLPKRMLESGFSFIFPEIEPAVKDILSTKI